MKAKLLAVLALALASPAAAQSLRGSISDPSQAALISNDPLMRQILRRQLTQENGGVTATARLGSGQAVELKLGPLELPVSGAASLRAVPTYLPVTQGESPIKARKPARSALEQLRKTEREGWK